MLVTATAVSAAEPAGGERPRYVRFEPEIRAFARHDQTLGGGGGSTLFVGSSSIRLWDVAHSFPAGTVINRGFGGATTPDVLHYYPEVVARHQPASIIVYVGENDIAAGAEPRMVVADVATLLARLRRDHPQARIVYLSMKPSPARWALWSKMATVNAQMRARSANGGAFDYLDVGSALLTREGAPGRQYFTPDGLHLNARGYALWTGIVDSYLKPAAPASRPAARPVSPNPMVKAVSTPARGGR